MSEYSDNYPKKAQDRKRCNIFYNCCTWMKDCCRQQEAEDSAQIMASSSRNFTKYPMSEELQLREAVRKWSVSDFDAEGWKAPPITYPYSPSPEPSIRDIKLVAEQRLQSANDNLKTVSWSTLNHPTEEQIMPRSPSPPPVEIDNIKKLAEQRRHSLTGDTDIYHLEKPFKPKINRVSPIQREDTAESFRADMHALVPPQTSFDNEEEDHSPRPTVSETITRQPTSMSRPSTAATTYRQITIRGKKRFIPKRGVLQKQAGGMWTKTKPYSNIALPVTRARRYGVTKSKNSLKQQKRLDNDVKVLVRCPPWQTWSKLPGTFTTSTAKAVISEPY